MGIGGVVTFKNAGLDKTLKKVALDHLVLETDSPYLAPVPFRGKRNQPAYLTHIVQKLSEIYKISIKEIQETTTQNARDLFKLDP
jgi:TatD DNase family protein